MVHQPQAPASLPIHLEVVAETCRLVQVRCQGNIIVPDYGANGEPFARLLGENIYERTVLLDMDDATFLDTSGVTWLVSAHRNFENAGGRLILHTLPPRVRSVLRLLSLESVLHTAADAPAALGLVAKETP